MLPSILFWLCSVHSEFGVEHSPVVVVVAVVVVVVVVAMTTWPRTVAKLAFVCPVY